MSHDRGPETPEPVALEAYDVLAESYAALVDDKPHNAHYERPATLSLLPEVGGGRVLDAGCGPGVYAEWLADRGAEVVALDVSEGMVRCARERLGVKARVLRADLGLPLDFLEDASFDVVLSALVLDHVEDWGAVFAEFFRVLRGGGRLVFSVEHPSSTFVRHVYGGEGNYFETELVSTEFTGFRELVRVPAFRRPLGAMIDPLLRAGFALERVLEPTPTEQFANADPEEHEKLSRIPGFLCLRAAASGRILTGRRATLWPRPLRRRFGGAGALSANTPILAARFSAETMVRLRPARGSRTLPAQRRGPPATPGPFGVRPRG